MRAQPITVRLGDAEWRVRPLTLLQIQEIEPLLRASDQSTGRSIAMAIKIIAVALTRDHPAAAETLSEIEADTQEIGAAMADVLRLGGFIARTPAEQGDTEPGEAQAGADSISVSSTPA